MSLLQRLLGPKPGEVWESRYPAHPWTEPHRARIKEVKDGWVRFYTEGREGGPPRPRPTRYSVDTILGFRMIYRRSA